MLYNRAQRIGDKLGAVGPCQVGTRYSGTWKVEDRWMVLDAMAMDVDVDVMAVDGYDWLYGSQAKLYKEQKLHSHEGARATSLTLEVFRVPNSELDIE
ncbi:hypothetical protein BOTCAL_0079g00030 [Botryotinia calthae]|uniref:Uncharacterized protein n=1 Tax=Botryotinia calthae TaxID=38488 RepID=A0A4Y8D8I2_9HELO|nr:hypothetical protein BOTCAL_0079g00030 [Botryotinia calthae]